MTQQESQATMPYPANRPAALPPPRRRPRTMAFPSGRRALYPPRGGGGGARWQVHIRPRITADRGATRLNSAAAAAIAALVSGGGGAEQ